ncbi:MAG: glycosyltransferase [Pseudomonadota bacterium]
MREVQELPSESDVRKWWKASCEPLVSIVCITYNHAAFIEECIRGLLIQRTRFPFSITVYDDASTDGTPEILKTYRDLYPNLISLCLQSENQRSQGKKLYSDVVDLGSLAKYIARCEGDDYWTDPEKLQKQVGFLEDNPSYVLVTHNVHSVDEAGTLVSKNHLPEFYKDDFSAWDLMLGWAGPVTQSMVFRNVLKELPPEFRRAPNGDVFLATLLGQHGRSGYLDDIGPSMYRLHGGGVFSPLSVSDKFDMQSLTFFWIYKYFKRTGQFREARAFKLKLMEKQLRELSFLEWVGLAKIRFLKGNTRKWVYRLLSWRRF